MNLESLYRFYQIHVDLSNEKAQNPRLTHFTPFINKTELILEKDFPEDSKRFIDNNEYWLDDRKSKRSFWVISQLCRQFNPNLMGHPSRWMSLLLVKSCWLSFPLKFWGHKLVKNVVSSNIFLKLMDAKFSRQPFIGKHKLYCICLLPMMDSFISNYRNTWFEAATSWKLFLPVSRHR